MPRRKPTARSKTTNDGAGDDGAGDDVAGDDVGQTSGDPAVDAVPGSDPILATEPAPTAFDLFVERGLHAIYDGVLAEPIPDELLRLIEDDRRRE